MTDRPQNVLSDTSASFLELFFDLVFVFAITQVTALLRENVTNAGLAQGALLLAMLWWTWSIYTYTTNWTGTARIGIRLSLLGAMGATLVMSVGVAEAFGDAGLWFAVPYFFVRGFAWAIYWIGAQRHEQQRKALMTILPISMGATTLVLVGGFFDDTTRVVLWVAALLIDLASAASGGRVRWELGTEHFAERNGLFVIIALGESIVAIGIGASHVERTASLVVTLILAFVGAAALWWSYFDKAQEAAAGYLTRFTGQERVRFARDYYTLLHYPIVLGIVLYAFAVEEVVAHPAAHLEGEYRFALAVGTSLVLLAVVVGSYRAARQVPIERLAAAVALVVLAILGGDLRADVLTAIVVVVLVAALVRERIYRWPRVEIAD